MRSPRERRALQVFVVVELVAAGMWLWLGTKVWFHADDWAYLADRDGGDLSDLFRPQGQHWSTVPILAFRGLWNVVGLHSYVPYLLPVIAAHLTVAALLRLIMLRSAVDPWIAAAAASAFALFGAGRENIIFAIQIGYSWALALNLAAVVLAHHDGPLTRRDVAGVLCCVASLLFCGVSVSLVGTVTLVVLLRRGLAIAAVYALVPAAVFMAWVATAGSGKFKREGTPREVAEFVVHNLRSTVDAIGSTPPLSIGLAIVLVIGLPLAVRHAGGLRSPTVSAPLGLAVGAFAFALSTGLGRAATSEVDGAAADASRYLHIGAALLLPALVLAASAIATRWPAMFVPMVLVFALGIPLNVREAVRDINKNESYFDTYRARLLTIGGLPVAREVPRSMRPESALPSALLTVGLLVDGVELGRIPPPPDDAVFDRTALVAYLVLHSAEDDAAAIGCEPLGPELRPLDKGQRLVATGRVVLVMGATSSAPAGDVERYVLPGHPLHVLVDGIEVGARSGTVLVCPGGD